MKKIFILLLIVIMPIMTFALPKGDVDGNGKVGSMDFVLVRNHITKKAILTGERLARADVNDDGIVSSLDYISIRNMIINGTSEPTSTPTATPTATSTPTPIQIPNMTCNGTITRDGTSITVDSPTSGVKEYEWIINGKTIKGTSTYSEYKIIDKASVNVIFNDGQKRQVECIIQDKLIYRFNYDLSKPHETVIVNGEKRGKLGGKLYFYKSDLYTANDKKKYDKMLKNAIKEAGYGTRAGVVEAARFMMGGMDYMVGYQSPKKNHLEIGSYPYVGLNIGNSKAWGACLKCVDSDPPKCCVQGLDCTNFIEWVMVQNGLNISAYNDNHQPTRDVVDKLRVGDFLYTWNSKEGHKHVALIVGVDENYIYYAEGGGGITKQKKAKMKKWPVEGSLARAYFPKYKKDGDVKDMWLTK